jgi:serine/threonine protein kinase
MVESIGEGGFGTVYMGVHCLTGETAAVKRVALRGMAQEDIKDIEQEMELLQTLKHPNIMRCVDAIRDDEYLNIIFEYCENLALSSMIAKFGGQLPESLVAHYIAHVLSGLEYLHEQDIIHRDIKGTNILSTKEGLVKLAGFGVAIKVSELTDHFNVVGTPYWMAPEIIEMTGKQNSACDIWSVGCTTVELLTGKPPYFDLPPMRALFKIVQDEYPPLPPNISPAMLDFLMLCFQKDPNRRINAKDLLKHPWLQKKEEMEKQHAAV